MENVQQSVNFEKLTDDQSHKLIGLCFDFYDLYLNNEEYEEKREEIIGIIKDLKPNEIKIYMKSVIDVIDKVYKTDIKFFEENLRNSLNMNKNQIQIFKDLYARNSEKIEKYKYSLLGKVLKGKILDFSYKFCTKYGENNNEKIEFLIRIMIKFINDNSEEDNLDLELSINQFYNLYSEFQKIDTMIKTLAS